ncbi:MAG: helix-turn-helix domain-containing protein [Bacilli bacterium]|nr:helix-turn-helix domain-containing protein [Bacilli bacterium]
MANRESVNIGLSLGKLGQNIVLARKKKGISQLRLAVLSGTSKSYICDLEHGRRNVSVALIYKIASALGVEVSTLFKGTMS